MYCRMAWRRVITCNLWAKGANCDCDIDSGCNGDGNCDRCGVACKIPESTLIAQVFTAMLGDRRAKHHEAPRPSATTVSMTGEGEGALMVGVGSKAVFLVVTVVVAVVVVEVDNSPGLLFAPTPTPGELIG